LPRYLEFLRDTQRVGLGVVVGAPGWEAQLEANKVAYAAEFVERAEFTSLYPLSQTPALTPLALAVTKRYGIGGLKAAMDVIGFTGGAFAMHCSLPPPFWCFTLRPRFISTTSGTSSGMKVGDIVGVGVDRPSQLRDSCSCNSSSE
jgi:hypothetical protein